MLSSWIAVTPGSSCSSSAAPQPLGLEIGTADEKATPDGTKDASVPDSGVPMKFSKRVMRVSRTRHFLFLIKVHQFSRTPSQSYDDLPLVCRRRNVLPEGTRHSFTLRSTRTCRILSGWICKRISSPICCTARVGAEETNSVS